MRKRSLIVFHRLSVSYFTEYVNKKEIFINSTYCSLSTVSAYLGVLDLRKWIFLEAEANDNSRQQRPEQLCAYPKTTPIPRILPWLMWTFFGEHLNRRHVVIGWLFTGNSATAYTGSRGTRRHHQECSCVKHKRRSCAIRTTYSYKRQTSLVSSQ